MVNFERDPEKIKAAYESGIITPQDCEKWQGVQGYKAMLKKSHDDSEISKSTFANEGEKVESYFFERDLSCNQFRFILKGVDFEPIDLFKQSEILKSMEQIPLKRVFPRRDTANETMRKVNAAVGSITQMAEEIKKRKLKQ